MQITHTTAAILVEQQQPLQIDTIELPEQLAYGQVLVALKYSGICGSQLGEIAGVKGKDRFLPHLLGHEGSGVVLETGPGVSTVASGDRVVLHWRPGCGIAAEPPKYRWKGRCLNAGWVTTFNQHAVVSENRLTTIPSDTDLEQAALYGCAITTGFGVINNDAALKLGESVVILGAGGVGLSMVQGAALSGGHPIVAVDLHKNRLELTRQLGATHTFEGVHPDEIHKIVGRLGADVVIDNTGNPEVIEQAYNLTKADGRTILVGVPPHDKKTQLFSLPLHFGKTLKGSHGGDAQPTTDIPRYLKLAECGKLALESLISDQFSLSQINEAIAGMRSGSIAGRCLITL